MKAKSVNTILNILIAVFIAWGVYETWSYFASLAAPEYEVVNIDMSWEYEFTNDDGQKIVSRYLPAWHDGKPVAYDPIYKKSSTFKAEYENEISQKMPPSQYGTLSHWMGVISIVMAVIAAIALLLLGIVVKEYLLAVYAGKTRRFSDVTFFFKEDRWAGNAIARKAYRETVADYVTRKRKDIQAKYKPEAASMLIGMLDYIRYADSPKIPYLLTMSNNTMSMPQYITKSISYWEQQIGKNSDAENAINFFRSKRDIKYEGYTIFTKASDIAANVSVQLDKIFETLMGDHIFTFESYERHYKPELTVNVELVNAFDTFSPNGKDYLKYPGVGVYVSFTRKGSLIWRQFLAPKCDYTYEENSFSSSDMYENMIKTTLATLSEKVK
jgi:hypothetical protein